MVINKEIKKILDEAVLTNNDKCIIWPYDRLNGYAIIRELSYDQIFSVHNFICSIVNGSKPTNIHQVAHSCGNGKKGCISGNHLRWATPKENIEDRTNQGRTYHPDGELNGQSKLTYEEISEIIELYSQKIYSQHKLARIFNVSQSHVSRIIRGKRWGEKDERRSRMKSLF